MAKPSGEPQGWVERPRNVTRIFRGLVLVCVAIGLADFLYHKHVHYDFEQWPGFYGVYGFVSCVGLVLLAKQLRRLIKRDEDYYGD